MTFIPSGITKTVARQVLLAKKHSPGIFFTAGVAGVIGGTVLACKATLKLDRTLEPIKKDVSRLKSMKEYYFTEGENDSHEYYKDLLSLYSTGTYRVVKLYGPSIVIGGLSIGALTGSHVALTRRNAALTAAYAAVAKSFDEYRDRVREKVGEDEEKDIYHAAEIREIETPEGKIKAKVADPNHWSPYAKMFDEFNPNWQKNAELNALFIQCQQNYTNNLLQARGHVFLNEVYDMLGIDRTQAGQVVGWVIGHDGDNYVDFGIFETYNSDFVNGQERSIILDFNVDGVIYDKI
jgi:Family of unknown function (DUF6353)